MISTAYTYISRDSLTVVKEMSEDHTTGKLRIEQNRTAMFVHEFDKIFVPDNLSSYSPSP